MAALERTLERYGRIGWNIVGVGLAAWGLALLARPLRPAILAVVAALVLTRALWRPADWLSARLHSRGLVAAGLVLLIVATLVGGFYGAGVLVSRQRDELQASVDQIWDDIGDRADRGALFGLDEGDVRDLRDDATATLRDWAGSPRVVSSGSRLAAELAAGLLLAIVLSFYFLKDGRALSETVAQRLAPTGTGLWERRLSGAWQGLGAFLRGALVLGLLEGGIVAVTLAIVGAEAAVAVGLLTLAGAFVPILGAIAAGVIAVLVALVTAGTVEALIVAGVILVVQQLDNDLLAPLVYGRALSIHPIVVILVIAVSTALAGLAGAVLAMPVLASVAGAATTPAEEPAGEES
jgi:putative heme transporter